LLSRSVKVFFHSKFNKYYTLFLKSKSYKNAVSSINLYNEEVKVLIELKYFNRFFQIWSTYVIFKNKSVVYWALIHIMAYIWTSTQVPLRLPNQADLPWLGGLVKLNLMHQVRADIFEDLIYNDGNALHWY